MEDEAKYVNPKGIEFEAKVDQVVKLLMEAEDMLGEEYFEVLMKLVRAKIIAERLKMSVKLK
jgi:hypothetical protein